MTIKGVKAHQRYRVKQGFIVPGVTTIIGQLDKPALVPWAWKLGMQGLDYRKTVGQAANIGSIVHHLIECHLKNEKPYLDEYPLREVQMSQVAYAEFEEWWMQQDMKMIGSEVQLVSEKYRYGGTIDIVACKVAADKIRLLDIKTSKGVYDEMRYQLAAYVYLWNENHPDQPIESSHIIHINKETGSIGFVALGNLDTEFQIFLHLRDIYELKGRSDPKRRQDKLYKVPYWYE